jgi:hypothetical protein
MKLCKYIRTWNTKINPNYFYPGANPTIESYTTRAVNFYNATSSLVRFENIFFNF